MKTGAGKKKKYLIILLLLTGINPPAFGWGFYAHRKINYQAVFLLPPQMIRFYKAHIDYLSDHAVDPDKKRYVSDQEAAHHYIDIDRYGPYPYDSLPRNWSQAVARFSEDTLKRYGIAPWWVEHMLGRLTEAFRTKNEQHILKYSAEIAHYIADIHVPLHTNSNHNGQLTGQEGIHAFWESRIPELLAEKSWDFFVGHAEYIARPSAFIWGRVLESAQAADTVLRAERQLSASFASTQKYAFEERKGKVIRQYSTAYTKAYDEALHGMVQRRMRAAIFAVASFWYTAWVNAGQPDLNQLEHKTTSEAEQHELEALDEAWRTRTIKGREETP
jgi:S1/P1 Nuclease